MFRRPVYVDDPVEIREMRSRPELLTRRGRTERSTVRGLLDHLRATGLLGIDDRGFDEPPAVEAGRVGSPDELGTLLAMGHRVRERLEGNHRGAWHQAMPMCQPVGGMDTTVAALASALTTEVRTGAVVVKVGEESNGVTVEPADGASLHADHGICTLPPHLASTIPSPWPRAVQRLLQASTPVTTGKLALEYDRRFWELDDRIFGGASRTDRPPRTIWYPSHGYLELGGIVVGAYPFGPAVDEFTPWPSRLRSRALASCSGPTLRWSGGEPSGARRRMACELVTAWGTAI
jgi:monoamine oxidase